MGESIIIVLVPGSSDPRGLVLEKGLRAHAAIVPLTNGVSCFRGKVP
jgi:hypothetical protein